MDFEFSNIPRDLIVLCVMFTSLIHDIDGFVRQEAVINVPERKR